MAAGAETDELLKKSLTVCLCMRARLGTGQRDGVRKKMFVYENCSVRVFQWRCTPVRQQMIRGDRVSASLRPITHFCRLKP